MRVIATLPSVMKAR